MFNEYEKLGGNGTALKAIKKAQAGNGSLVMAQHAIAGNRSAALATQYAEVGEYSICMARNIKMGKNSVGVVLGQNNMPLAIVTTSKLPVMTYEAYQKFTKKVGMMKDTTETIFTKINEYMDHQEYIALHNE